MTLRKGQTPYHEDVAAPLYAGERQQDSRKTGKTL